MKKTAELIVRGQYTMSGQQHLFEFNHGFKRINAEEEENLYKIPRKSVFIRVIRG